MDKQKFGFEQYKFGAENPIGSGDAFFGLAPKVYDKGAAIANDFRKEQIVKDYNATLNKSQSVKSIIDKGVGGPGDLAIVYEFMNGLDPTSVVRESEYAAAAKSGNIFQGALARFNGYLKEEGGILPDNVKSAFSSILDSKFKVATGLYDNLRNEYARRIDNATGSDKGKDFLTDYSKADPARDPLLVHIQEHPEDRDKIEQIEKLGIHLKLAGTFPAVPALTESNLYKNSTVVDF